LIFGHLSAHPQNPVFTHILWLNETQSCAGAPKFWISNIAGDGSVAGCEFLLHKPSLRAHPEK
jgi:hypothetical protein